MLLSDYTLFSDNLEAIKKERALINTLNAYSYIVSKQDFQFQESLKSSHILLPDGIGVVHGIRWLTKKKIKKIAGYDLFIYEMNRIENISGKVFFLGSTEIVLNKIENRIKKDYPDVQVKTYSPPFKSEFSDEDNLKMIEAVNSFNPDVLFIGMTAPKQEKWAYQNYNKLQTGHICCVGAVFEFYAQTIKRAPKWMITFELEWLYRVLREFPRMRKRIIANIIFIFQMIREKNILLKESQSKFRLSPEQ